MRVLAACEYSGAVRRAFAALGHDAWSCDLLPAEDDSPNHIQGDVLGILAGGWDLMIGFPPCTHLCVSGARWFKDKREEQAEALDFVRLLLAAPIPRIAIETPSGSSAATSASQTRSSSRGNSGTGKPRRHAFG